MSAPNSVTRPWYCKDQAVDEYRDILNSGESPDMLKKLKLLRSIIVNVGLFVMWYISLTAGLESLFYNIAFLLTIALYNGLEVQDYLQLAQAYKEVSSSKE